MCYIRKFLIGLTDVLGTISTGLRYGAAEIL